MKKSQKISKSAIFFKKWGAWPISQYCHTPFCENCLHCFQSSSFFVILEPKLKKVVVFFE